MMMRISSGLWILLTGLVSGGWVLGQERELRGGIANGIAVIVNDKVITYQEVQRAMLPTMELLQRQYGDRPETLIEKLNEAQKQQIEGLVEKELILHEFKTAGYNLPESLIEDEIQRRIREQFGDRFTLTKTLKEEGVMMEEYRRRVREQFIVSQMRYQNVAHEIILSPYKIEKYYEENAEKYQVGDQVKLHMIYLRKEGDEEGDRLKGRLALELLNKLKGGAEFGEIAKVYSEGSQRSEGGDWGWVEKSVLREELSEKAFSQPVGHLSEVIETPDGFYLMRVDERQIAHVKSLSDVREEISQELRSQEVNRLNRQWIERLKKKSFVRYY